MGEQASREVSEPASAAGMSCVRRRLRATDALPWLTSTLVLLGAPLLAQHAGTGVSIRILEQHPDRLRLAYSLGSSMNGMMPEGGSISAGLLGSLCKTTVVGIPLAGEVELEILEVSPAGAFDMPVLPDGEWDLRLDGPVFLGEPGFVRNQRVVRVNFAPRVADGGSQAQLFTRVVADLHFAAAGSHRPRNRHPAASRVEQFYRQALINYEQAIAWRQTPAAAKPVADGTAPDRIRITVRQPGLHRLTGAELAALGVSLSEIDPDAIRVWYGGGFTLGLSSQPHLGVRLRQIPIAVDDEDGRFDSDDAVMFYGEPAERWVFSSSNGGTYSWRQNPYTRDNVYFLEWTGEGSGLRAGIVSGALTQPDVIHTDRYRDRVHEEVDTDTFIELLGIKSGYDWYWETFQGSAKEFTTSLRDVVPEEPVEVAVRFWGFSQGSHRFEIKWNDRAIGVRSFSGAAAQTLSAFARQGTLEGENRLTLSPRDNTETRLDWYELEYSRLLRARDDVLSFDWLGATGLTTDEVSSANSTAQFLLSGFEDAPRIFEFRAPRTLKEIVDFDYNVATGSATFQGQYTGFGTPPQFLATGDDGWKRPATIEAKRHARLKTSDHGAEYVIITHEDFRAAADKLAAWRAVDDRFGPPLTTHVADVEDVYDEFSGGLVDPMAIRSFVNFAVDNWDPAPVFILLMGDGSYDYRNNLVNSHPNWIPPYQDGSSMYDEWYVRIEGGDDLPDLAIGRLPVGSASEADAVVDKLIAYDRDPEIGPWQTRVLLVADDRVNPSTKENESFFVRDAERMAKESLPPDLDVSKLYFGEFQLEGRTKPTARDAFVKKFNEGALILTYIGHGNPETIAHEQVFVLSRDIKSIDNGRRLPLVYTAASQIGVFDEPSRRSMPEVFINDPDGGVIGFISATRVGFHISNMNLAREFHATMYTSGDDRVPVGLALAIAKHRVPSTFATDRVNIQRYSLLGDPAQTLNRPFLKVQIEAPDSFNAFQEVRIQGRVQDASGRGLTDFAGEALVQVFDSAVLSLTEGTRWKQPGAPIFRSLTPVRDGVFEAVFRVPRDISYRESNGRISAYVWGEGMPTAFGSTSGIEIGGTQPGIAPDDDGPTVTLAFNGAAQFIEGGVVPNRSVLTASIEDGSGINITGEVGHEIELEIDDDLFTVTDLYNSQNGNYQTGMLQFELPALEPGSHDLSLRIWDNSNNSSRVEATFQVLDATFLSSVIFHPNPLQDQGHFTYLLKSDAQAVSIKVFTLSGRLIDQIVGSGEAGYNQVSWELPAGLANGVYLYRILVIGEDGFESEATSAMQVLR